MPLIPIRPKGRPSSVCEHCKDVRQRKKTNDGCICDSPNHIPTCPCAFKQELCTCKPSKRASSSASITKRQTSKGRRSTTTTAELLTKTPSNNPLLPQPRAMSVTDTCKVTDEEEDENLHLKETPDFLSQQTVNYLFDFVGNKHQNQQKLAILKTPPSRSNSVDNSTLTTAHSTPVQSPLSSSVTIANTYSEPSPKTQPPVTLSSSFKLRPPSMTPDFPTIRFLRDGDEQDVTLPVPRRFSVAYSPSSDSGSPKSFESSKGCPNNDNKTTVHTTSTYNGNNFNYSRYKYSDRLPLPPLIPSTKVVRAIDSPWSWKSIPPTKLSTLLDPDTFLDRTDHNYRRASIGSLPSLSTTSSLYLPSISSITYTVSSTRTSPAANRLGRWVSIDEATRCNDKSPQISKFLHDGNTSGTDYKQSISTQDTKSIKVAELPSIKNVNIKTKLKYEQDNQNFRSTRLSPLIPGRVSKNTRTSIQSLIHSSSPTTQ